MSVKPAQVSVVVASRERPDYLVRCLAARGQQFHDDFEVVVVADGAGIDAVVRAGFRDRVKLRRFEKPNISAARNIGLDLAAGEIVAFIDDDAAAEPTWLQALVEPFSDPGVVASTGFVRGRNGVCFQSRAHTIDCFGVTGDLRTAGDAPFMPDCAAGMAVKTVGTNCGFRKATLMTVGGFDESYRFYLEDADVALRVAGLGRTAVVPRAQVHHAFASSDRRRQDRVPKTLFEIGRSNAVFLRRHAPNADMIANWLRLLGEQRTRLLDHQVSGRLLPGDVRRVLRGLSDGWRDGLSIPVASALPARAPRSPAFCAFKRGEDRLRASTLDALPVRAINRARTSVPRVCAQGVQTILALDLSPRPLRVSFELPGVWYHRGGLFGRVFRDSPRLSFARYRQRVADEALRIAEIRGLSLNSVKVL